ncbi:hypothetical protein [Aeromicrobium sp.]|uniref:hypothetical protein n=1 Tax=Aeromicrobium sp. TaxID=1871063 RepID=UPI002FC94D25
MRRLALVAGVSALFLTLCDQLFHVRTETLVYHWDPQVAGQTIIVPLTFLLATSSMLDTSTRVNAVQPRSTSARGVIASLAIVTAAYLISGFVDQKYAIAYALLLLVSFGARFVLRKEGAAVLVSAVAIAIGGVLGEAVLSAIGEFSYLQPDVIGVPWWLFPLYLHGALAARDIAAAIRDSSNQDLERTSTTSPTHPLG